MVTSMNTMTRPAPAPIETYSDEVLNANWLPQAMLAALGLPPGSPRSRQTRSSNVKDPETFMARLYRSQE